MSIFSYKKEKLIPVPSQIFTIARELSSAKSTLSSIVMPEEFNDEGKISKACECLQTAIDGSIDEKGQIDGIIYRLGVYERNINGIVAGIPNSVPGEYSKAKRVGDSVFVGRELYSISGEQNQAKKVVTSVSTSKKFKTSLVPGEQIPAKKVGTSVSTSKKFKTSLVPGEQTPAKKVGTSMSTSKKFKTSLVLGEYSEAKKVGNSVFAGKKTSSKWPSGVKNAESRFDGGLRKGNQKINLSSGVKNAENRFDGALRKSSQSKPVQVATGNMVTSLSGAVATGGGGGSAVSGMLSGLKNLNYKSELSTSVEKITNPMVSNAQLISMLKSKYNLTASEAKEIIQYVASVKGNEYLEKVLKDYEKIDNPEKFKEKYGFSLFEKDANGKDVINKSGLLLNVFNNGFNVGEADVTVSKLGKYIDNIQNSMFSTGNKGLTKDSAKNLQEKIKQGLDKGYSMRMEISGSEKQSILLKDSKTGKTLETINKSQSVTVVGVSAQGVIVSSSGKKRTINFSDMQKQGNKIELFTMEEKNVTTNDKTPNKTTEASTNNNVQNTSSATTNTSSTTNI